eukprot:1652197-Rhodomonas_salina.1
MRFLVIDFGVYATAAICLRDVCYVHSLCPRSAYAIRSNGAAYASEVSAYAMLSTDVAYAAALPAYAARSTDVAYAATRPHAPSAWHGATSVHC